MFEGLFSLLSSHSDDDDDDECAGPPLARIQQEIAVLQKKNVPEHVYHFFFDEKKPYVVFAARTKKRVYTLRIELSGFPNNVPKVFVTKMLKDKYGEKLDSADGSMHVLESEHGWTRICHYGDASWTPNVSLYKIYVKCCLWLNMYELHLETGNDIEYYLNHQK